MKKVYTGLLEASAEQYLSDLFTGTRTDTLVDEDVTVMLIQAAMYISSNAPYGDPSGSVTEWAPSPNPGGGEDWTDEDGSEGV